MSITLNSAHFPLNMINCFNPSLAHPNPVQMHADGYQLGRHNGLVQCERTTAGEEERVAAKYYSRYTGQIIFIRVNCLKIKVWKKSKDTDLNE
jgi:hypothetical protein